MAIEKRQPGEAKAAAQAGTAIGQGQKAIRQEAQAIQQQQQQAALKAREASEQRAMQWELEKMQMRSQQDFEQELRAKQFDYDKVNRAKEWDIEKLSIASQMDFERDEKERQRKMTVYQTKLTAMEEAAESGQVDRKNEIFVSKKAEYERLLMFAETGDTFRAAPDESQKFGIQPWYEKPGVRDSQSATAARDKAQRIPEGSREYGIQPWYNDPKLAGSPEAIAARDKSEREEGRYQLTQESAARSKESHEKRMEETQVEKRARLSAIVGEGVAPEYLSMAQLEEKANYITGETSGEVTKPPTAEELHTIGTRAAHKRGQKLGYWN